MSEITFRRISEWLDNPMTWDIFITQIWLTSAYLLLMVFGWEIVWFLMWAFMFFNREAKFSDLWRNKK